MYVHVPAAWMASFVYAVMAVASAVGLIWRHPLADIAARAAAPLGAGFTLICLVTGSLWGEPMWGTWWVWDARLTSVLVLFFLYLGYIALVNAFDEPTRGARAGAILAIVGVVNLPIIKFSVDWWNTLHQPASVFRLGGPTIDPSMLWPLLVMALGFSLFFVTLLLLRMRTALIAAKVRALRLAEASAAPRPRSARTGGALTAALLGFLAMGGYARFVWPAYGVTFAVLLWMLLDSVGAYRRRRRELEALQREPAMTRKRRRLYLVLGGVAMLALPRAGAERVPRHARVLSTARASIHANRCPRRGLCTSAASSRTAPSSTRPMARPSISRSPTAATTSPSSISARCPISSARARASWSRAKLDRDGTFRADERAGEARRELHAARGGRRVEEIRSLAGRRAEPPPARAGNHDRRARPLRAHPGAVPGVAQSSVPLVGAAKRHLGLMDGRPQRGAGAVRAGRGGLRRARARLCHVGFLGG